MILTTHFVLSEFTRSETAERLHIDNTPNEEQIANLRNLCEKVLEPLRERFGAIIISSGFRCQRLNTAVGGARNSQHKTGEACDIHLPSTEIGKAYFEFLKETEKNLRILQYGYQLKSDNFSEQIVTDRLSVVTERVKDEVIASNDKFAAVVQCVDEPWDVALVELWLREVNRSARGNIDELQKNGKLF